MSTPPVLIPENASTVENKAPSINWDCPPRLDLCYDFNDPTMFEELGTQSIFEICETEESKVSSSSDDLFVCEMDNIDADEILRFCAVKLNDVYVVLEPLSPEEILRFTLKKEHKKRKGRPRKSEEDRVSSSKKNLVKPNIEQISVRPNPEPRGVGSRFNLRSRPRIDYNETGIQSKKFGSKQKRKIEMSSKFSSKRKKGGNSVKIKDEHSDDDISFILSNIGEFLIF